jgi:hypothetical protein
MNYQRLAERSWTTARVRQWVTAAIVSKKSIRLETDDIMTKLRGAWIMFDFIRDYCPAEARQLRKDYGYSRFYDLYKEWRRYEFAPDICIEHLRSDLSNAGMVMQIVDTCDPRPEWERNAVTIYGKVTKLVQVSYDSPQWFKDWASETEKLFKERGIK